MLLRNLKGLYDESRFTIRILNHIIIVKIIKNKIKIRMRYIIHVFFIIIIFIVIPANWKTNFHLILCHYNK